MRKKILIVDDEKLMRDFVTEALKDKFSVVSVASSSECESKIKEDSYDLILLDMKLPDGDGIEFLPTIKNFSPESEVIMMTAYGTIENAVLAMKRGASDFLKKPFSLEELEVAIKKVFEHRKLENENKRLKEELQEEYSFGNLIGKNKRMQEIYKIIKIVAPTNTTVLIQGESGTGKELVARAIHYNSLRKNDPFVSINCASIPEGLLESELFGHEKGAFTGAIKTRKGKFELADKGTLLLDEISEMSLPLQAKLLRVLQDLEFYRVGGTQNIKVDVRIIATTNRDLKKLVKEKKFREDLFYRINIIPINLPPLRERKDDIPLLVNHFITKYSKNKRRRLSSKAMDSLFQYSFPGNVRELENIIERAIVLSESEVASGKSEEEISKEHIIIDDGALFSPEIKSFIGLTIEEVEKMLILETLKTQRGNKASAARILGITEKTLQNKLARYGEKITKDTEIFTGRTFNHQGGKIAI